jgi:hypothetical protein
MKTGLSVCLGVLIYIYANKTIDIVAVDINEEETILKFKTVLKDPS